MAEALLHVENLSKNFDRLTVLKDVTFSLGRGEVIGLVGRQGAGKSTLLHLLSGAIPASSGTITFDGVARRFTNRLQAQKLGIETVYQTFGLINRVDFSTNIFFGRNAGVEITRRTSGLVEQFTVSQNILLGHEIKKIPGLGVIDQGRMIEVSMELLAQFNLPPELANEQVRNLSDEQRQVVMLLRILYRPCRFLLLDDIIPILSYQRQEILLDRIKTLASQGTSVNNNCLLTLSIISCTMLNDNVVVTDNDNNFASHHPNSQGSHMSGNPAEERLVRTGDEPAYVTLQDVATFAGVSIKTVSRVVNNQGEISEATRQRVRAAIDELGYRPNVLARSLVNRRTDTLAVVAWGIEYFGPSRMMVGVEQQADKLGYSLFLNLVSQPDDPNPERILDTLLARRVEGIIWLVPQVGDNRNWLRAGLLERLPPIVFLSMQPQSGLAIAAVNNFSGARQATGHLIDQGRRKLAIITGPKPWWEAGERFAGWKSRLEEAGLAASPSLIVESYWSAAGGERAMQQLLKQAPDIDAVFASSDQIALGALGAIHQSGRRVPQDLAIVGFDNTPESAFYWPPLTTVYQKLVNVGHLAVQNLHQMIEARRQQKGYIEPALTLIEPELIVRASSR